MTILLTINPALQFLLGLHLSLDQGVQVGFKLEVGLPPLLGKSLHYFVEAPMGIHNLALGINELALGINERAADDNEITNSSSLRHFGCTGLASCCCNYSA